MRESPLEELALSLQRWEERLRTMQAHLSAVERAERKLYSISVFASHMAHRGELGDDATSAMPSPRAPPSPTRSAPPPDGRDGAAADAPADGAASASALWPAGLVPAPYASHTPSGGLAPRTPRVASRSPSAGDARGAARPATAGEPALTYTVPLGWGARRATPTARRPPSAAPSPSASRALAPLAGRTPPRAGAAARARRAHHASLSTSEFRELNRLRAATAPSDGAERRRAPSPPRADERARGSRLPTLLLSEAELELVDSWRAQHGVLQEGVGPSGPDRYAAHHIRPAASGPAVDAAVVVAAPRER